MVFVGICNKPLLIPLDPQYAATSELDKGAAMRSEDYPKWFTQLLKSFEAVRINRGDGQKWYDEEKANEWITEAGAAIASVFLPS